MYSRARIVYSRGSLWGGGLLEISSVAKSVIEWERIGGGVKAGDEFVWKRHMRVRRRGTGGTGSLNVGFVLPAV